MPDKGSENISRYYQKQYERFIKSSAAGHGGGGYGGGGGGGGGHARP